MLNNLLCLLSISVFLLFSLLQKNNIKNTIGIMGVSSSLSLTSSCYWYLNGFPNMTLNINWLNSNLNEFSLSFIIDPSFIIFSTVALTVTWSIIEFSHYYMENDPNKQSFLNTLILFLFFMLILTSANNLFLLFVGWEGVGILSFILIGWWYTRAEANSAALQAIIYNRIGDSGILIFLSISILNFNSWNLNEIIFLNNNNNINHWACLGIIIAAAGKSAQFILHPWLPSAMEGPTPVSALLHSSTMVVAGVFLLFRSSNILINNNWSLPLISTLGSLTALFAASSALLQFDIKKVVAYSTTSQLGLMVVAIGLNIPMIAFFHICTHAFFKALLFLCSGSIIHSLNNEQDLRKMGNSSSTLPFTTSCIIISNLALCGTPFLSGFYSKDLILETCQTNITNSISVLLSLIATLMTIIYSFRVIYYISLVNINTPPISPNNEENSNLYNPFFRLIIGIFSSGWIGSLYFFNTSPIVIPIMLKSLPLLFLVYTSILILNNNSFNSLPILPNSSTFLAQNWFFVQITHQNSFFLFFNNSLNGVLRTLDQGWTTKIGAKGITNLILTNTNIIQKTITGVISNYILYLIIIIITIVLLI
uniref:NADH-ubiquinone oxidoreductase chain 5 n=1 Tax=Ophiarachnella gorgonia TaxID=1365872 RepID=A0A6C0FN95_9ECHI|nr:NADH dehydrogenase subunit 5 [Ophiarachnella gorgonia]QHT54255.1 NADH dehydrogenase subunit 5 [Ophiarachnella gorgonia]